MICTFVCKSSNYFSNRQTNNKIFVCYRYFCNYFYTLRLTLLATNGRQGKAMIKNSPKRLLALFSKKYYGAYDKMIDELRPMLMNPRQDCWLIERLEFYPDLPHGSLKRIYLSIARLLKPGSCVFACGYCKNDLFRWLADPQHCNLGKSFQVMQRAVNKRIKNDI